MLQPRHWTTRLAIALILIALSFIGMIITDFFPATAWRYWCYTLPFFALLCLWLSWLNSNHHLDGLTIKHEILHWIALMFAVYLVVIFVHMGMIGHVIAGLFILTLIAFGTILAGIYIDMTFFWIGLLLAFFAFASALLVKYIVIISLPFALIIVILLFWTYRKHHKKEQNEF